MNIDWKEHCGCYEAVVGGTHIAIGWLSFDLSEWDSGVIGAAWFSSPTTDRSYVEHVIVEHVTALAAFLNWTSTPQQRSVLRRAGWLRDDDALSLAGMVQMGYMAAYHRAGVEAAGA